MIFSADNSIVDSGKPAELPRSGAATVGPALVEMLLAEQRDLTAVERFSRRHDADAVDVSVGHAQSRHYQDLIPLSLPMAGEQYAFRVDLDACSGCKACVTACHQLNGLADDETWRSVGILIGDVPVQPATDPILDGRNSFVTQDDLPVLKHVTSACHHCVEPGCLSGCPTRAYEKDPATGIVRHLDDQCMGCQYCLLMCPYEVPQYQPALGIVRKCDMCRQRLAADEAPACVQSCPNRAISIEIVRREDAVAAAKVGTFLASCPDPRLTIPTTTYVSRDAALTALRAGDAERDRPQHAHLSLVAMLCLTQAGVGLLLIDQAFAFFAGDAWSEAARIAAAGVAAVVGIVGVGCAMLHLGRPALAVKAWLGWRTSWLSREVIVFGAWLPIVAANACAAAGLIPNHLHDLLSAGAVVTGLLGIFCSAMIYAATHRTWWSLPRNMLRFLGTSLTLGGAIAVCLAVAWAPTMAVPAAVGLTIAVAVKTVWELAIFRTQGSTARASLARTARLLAGPLRPFVEARAACTCVVVLGSYLLPAFPEAAGVWTAAMLASALLGELAERYLFFAAVVPPRMPGGIGA